MVTLRGLSLFRQTGNFTLNILLHERGPSRYTTLYYERSRGTTKADILDFISKSLNIQIEDIYTPPHISFTLVGVLL